MELKLSAEEQAFQQEIRTRFEEILPEDHPYRGGSIISMSRDEMADWQNTLNENGWGAIGWPQELGGTDWGDPQKAIFQAEAARVNAPGQSPFGVTMVGPVLCEFGTEAQKAQHLPNILDGSVFWCQGYSEPGSGSDLASLRTAAIRDGDDYVVNGQKIWTTQAHIADWIFCLVRTSTEGKPQQGISFLLIDMKSPGIEVKPIYTIDGDHHLNEVYFTDVRVPVDNLVGNENEGWTYAKFLLGNERAGIAGTDIILNGLANLKNVHDYLSETAGESYQADAFARRHAELSVRYESLQMLENRALFAAPDSGDGMILPLPMKTLGTELQQDMGDLAYDMLGADSTVLFTADFEPTVGDNEPNYRAHAPNQTHFMLFNRASTIFGGTTEVQKGIMSKFVLGL
ncbi:MAG: acyl-CoA dehydrogenase family protein [Parvibaculales bacterium]|nr:acyl-CoA dehydrogenase family protein [Alphaproteobacteria bacterium]